MRLSFYWESLLLSGLRLSLHRFLALVIGHSIVDSIACHRSCERSGNSRPEATVGRCRHLIHRLVDDGRVLLHNGRALRCIALRRSRTGERTTAAEPTTTSCFSCCRNEKGDRNGRHNSFLHRAGCASLRGVRGVVNEKKPAVLHHGLNYILTQASVSSETLAFACGFVSSGHAEAPISGAAESNREPTALSIPRYFSTFSSRESTISKNFATALSLCIRKVFCSSESFCSITLGEVKQQ